MIKRLLLTVGGLAARIVLIGGIKAHQIQNLVAQPAYSPPSEPVTTAVAEEETWTPVLSAVGSLSAIQGVTIAAQLDGTIDSIAFTAGSEVKRPATSLSIRTPPLRRPSCRPPKRRRPPSPWPRSISTARSSFFRPRRFPRPSSTRTTPTTSRWSPRPTISGRSSRRRRFAPRSPGGSEFASSIWVRP